MTIDWHALFSAACEARERAYAPYSNYWVGAALLTDDGRIVTGCNVENASYGLCHCAERNAVGTAVASGARSFSACVVVTQSTPPAMPCGMCRQVLAEFPPSFPIRAYAPDGTYVETSVAELLPMAFGPASLAGVRGAGAAR